MYKFGIKSSRFTPIRFHVYTVSHAVLHNETQTYAEAICETIRIGGESGARGMWIGSMLAAHQGSVDAIPRSWANATTK